MAIDKSAIKAFAKRWDGIGYEKGDTQQYWLQLLRALGYAHSDDVKFEYHLPGGGFIDVWIRDAGVLVEQKSIEIDLDKPEPRQGKLKTPLEQAMDYVVDLPLSEQPRFIITCNFKQFRIYDREKYGRSELADNAFEFTLEEMADRPEYLNIIVDPNNSRLEKEKQVSIEAGRLIGQLYDLMRDGYIDPDSEESQHALNVLCVRLVFCLYCEDSDLFPKDSFFNFLKDVPAQNIRTNLKRLFKALDTPVKERDPYDVSLTGFPYVNGGLFKDETEIPNFSEEAKDFLLNKVSAPVNWSQISPTIFGGIFESTLNPETRRKGGMHYTSPENIHKVIDLLFKKKYSEADGEELSLCIPELVLPKGKVISVIGCNGTGKTTFLRCICGLEKDCTGTIAIDGKEYRGRRRIGLSYLVMQDVNHQLFTDSVASEVLLSMKDKDDARCCEILDSLGLLKYKDTHPMALSGGQKQRVAIASAIAAGAEILLFDEPTSGLDYSHMEKVGELLHDLASSGKTVLVSTHDPELIECCCDYELYIKNGRVISFTGSLEKLEGIRRNAI